MRESLEEKGNDWKNMGIVGGKKRESLENKGITGRMKESLEE